MNCKNCNSILEPGAAFCKNCGQKVEEVQTVEKKNKTPMIIAIIIGAIVLLGGILTALIMLVLPNIGSNSGVVIDAYMKVKTDSKDYTISDHFYTIDWSDSGNASATKITVNALDSSSNKLFEITREWPKNSIFPRVTVKLNNGETVKIDEDIVTDSFDFYYLNDMLIFNARYENDEYYLYDMVNNKLFTAFSSKDEGNKGFVVNKIFQYPNNENVIAFNAELDPKSIDLFGTDKADIFYNLNNGLYKSYDELEKALKAANLDDFTVIKVYTFGKDNNVVKGPEYAEEKISTYYENHKHLFNNPSINVERTRDCVGVVEKGNNKYEYIVSFKNTETCEHISFKLNDDFTVNYHFLGATDNDFIYDINGSDIDSGILFGDSETFSIVGKTLVTRAFSTDLGAPVYLIKPSGEIYSALVGPTTTEYYNLDGMTTKAVRVDDNGDLIVSGTRHSNILGEEINGEYVNQVAMCNTSFSDLMSSHGVSEDYAFQADYTFKLKDDGLFNLEYASSKTTVTWKEFYQNLCE